MLPASAFSRHTSRVRRQRSCSKPVGWTPTGSHRCAPCAGFYIRQGEELLLGPFQGKVACTRIPLGKGVCGTAAKSGQTQLVKDVHEFPGHIACDSASNSEIVVPLWKDGEVWGVLDIDSPEKARFDEKDQEGLEAFARLLEELL